MFDLWIVYSAARMVEFCNCDGCFYGDLFIYFDYVMLLLLVVEVGCVVVTGFTFDCCSGGCC